MTKPTKPFIIIGNDHIIKAVKEMQNGELIQINVEEFSRIQSYMQLAEKDSEIYKLMKIRYIELKVILSALSVNLTELDIIKE